MPTQPELGANILTWLATSERVQVTCHLTRAIGAKHRDRNSTTLSADSTRSTLEYSYLSTGKAFIFLWVKEANPTTVFYHQITPDGERDMTDDPQKNVKEVMRLDWMNCGAFLWLLYINGILDHRVTRCPLLLFACSLAFLRYLEEVLYSYTWRFHSSIPKSIRPYGFHSAVRRFLILQ